MRTKRNLRKSLLRSCKARQASPVARRPPLRTVYESIIGASNAKRSRSSFSPGHPRKRRKPEKLDDTVIVLSDDEECEAIPTPPAEEEIIYLSDKVAGDLEVGESSVEKRPARQRKKKRRKKDEDLQIVWSSQDATVAPVESAKPGTSSAGSEDKEKSETFFVDTSGDASLLILDTFTIDDKNKSSDKSKGSGKNPKSGRNVENAGNNCQKKLREIVVDGCNVAMLHSLTRNKFSEEGLKLVLDYFVKRGHKVRIFLPQHTRSKSRKMLEQWYRQGIVVFTPSRKVAQKVITPYDDRFILDYATKCNGIVVSSDQYRDLWMEKPEWRETIEKRLLSPTFVGDYVMFPEDPLGRHGPRLNEFLLLP